MQGLTQLLNHNRTRCIHDLMTGEDGDALQDEHLKEFLIREAFILGANKRINHW